MEDDSVGSTMPFGEYNWRVLDIKNNTALIITENADNRWYGAKGGVDIEDRVFLLNIEDDFRAFITSTATNYPLIGMLNRIGRCVFGARAERQG